MYIQNHATRCGCIPCKVSAHTPPSLPCGQVQQILDKLSAKDRQPATPRSLLPALQVKNERENDGEDRLLAPQPPAAPTPTNEEGAPLAEPPRGAQTAANTSDTAPTQQAPAAPATASPEPPPTTVPTPAAAPKKEPEAGTPCPGATGDRVVEEHLLTAGSGYASTAPDVRAARMSFNRRCSRTRGSLDQEILTEFNAGPQRKNELFKKFVDARNSFLP